MKRSTRSIVSIFLSLSFLMLPLQPVKACAPDLAFAILLNGNHPDLPLKLFAAGNLGVIQPGWAKSYLVVAHRYLSGKPLSKQEQESIVRLWHKRIEAGSAFTTATFPNYQNEYIELRSKAIGADSKKNNEIYWQINGYLEQNNIGDSAFKNAKNVLHSILAKYPAKSQAVKDWVKAQDGIFGIGSEKTIVPSPLPASADALLQEYRDYQIAAANFYAKHYDKASSQFRKLADKSQFGLKSIASYMVLRSKSNQLLKGDGSGDADKVIAEIQKAADRATTDVEREDILNLQRPVSYLNLSAVEVAKTLSDSISNCTSKRFGGDVGDLTFLLDGNVPLAGLDVQGSTGSLEPQPASSTTSEKDSSKPDPSNSSSENDGKKPEAYDKNPLADVSDITDFVSNIQKDRSVTDGDPLEDRAKAKALDLAAAKYALNNWRKKKTNVWLVAALSGAGMNLQENRDLLDAAASCPPTSAAYLTCRFYVIDSLLSAGKRAEARKLLQPLLTNTNLPPTTRNLFSAQMASASESVSDYFKYAVLAPPEILNGGNDLVTAKFLKVETQNSFSTETSALDPDMAQDFDRNAPMSSWMQFAQSQAIPAGFKPVIIRSAWTRAEMLQREGDAAKLLSALAGTNPSLTAAVAKIKAAPAGPARQFAVACLILKNFGMTPYMQGGAERHGAAITAFDWYNNNFWVPLPVSKVKSDDDDCASYYNDPTGYVGDTYVKDKMKTYWQPGISRFLSASEKKAADDERQALFKNHPSRFLGQIVLDWAKLHPTDPEVPEMLYRIVRLPKWTTISPVGSEYSKKAYFALHKAYPGNQWTKKAVCYY